MKALYAGVVLAIIVCTPAWGGNWKACKKEKIEVVRLEQALGHGRKLAGYRSGSAMKKARRSKEEWLRKNCRYHSRQLRDLERELM